MQDTPLIDPSLTPGETLLAEGRALAKQWRLGTCLFLKANDVACEADYKRRMISSHSLMQHAHIGFRNITRTREGISELFDRAADRNVRIDRFGITLDWSMGYPPDLRTDKIQGTGIVLDDAEDFSSLTNASPAASHFGDFMLGLPAALHNVKAALVAGATSVGNLGQYFTFRLPYWDDDVATTEATVRALGLIAAQDQEVLVHSNLDDGFAGLFVDVTSAVGMVLIEKYIVEELIGAPCAFCYGHHFSNPATRMAFHAALSRITDTPGTMIFGNTVAYRSDPAANYASLSSYLLADIVALNRNPTGHAINPVPVTENVRIPDLDEILDAQSFASQLIEHADAYSAITDFQQVDLVADKLIKGGKTFADNALKGLADRDVDITDPAALLLAIRRIGAKRMETLWGIGSGPDENSASEEDRFVPADWVLELDQLATQWSDHTRDTIVKPELIKVALGTTDVHEHGAYLVKNALQNIGVEVVDAGVSVDAEKLVEIAMDNEANVIAVSTYNGIGLQYVETLKTALSRNKKELPILIGGKLNQVSEGSNSDLPVDVSAKLRETGAIPCNGLDDMLPTLKAIVGDIYKQE